MWTRASEVATALVISGVVSVGISIKDQGIQAALLENNMKVTKELTTAVTDLRLQLAIYGERYVTRDELDKKLKGVSKE
jgi:hypothetical protein